jgi:hypothetical protein
MSAAKSVAALVILGFVAVIALVVLLLIFAGNGAVTGNVQLNGASCFDSDNGKNYTSRGSVGVATFAAEDTCLRFPDIAYPGPGNFVKNGPYIAEGYCQNGNKIAFDVYTCPNGCINGICV